jgi:preprotein translocase subunit SecD
MGGVPWPQLALYGPTTILLGLLFVFILRLVHKMGPSWEKIKLRELDVREAEVKVKGEQAAALGQLGQGITQMAETLKEIGVDQRRATETIKILQRVNADTSDQMTRNMAVLTDRIDRFERRETNVELQRSGTEAH